MMIRRKFYLDTTLCTNYFHRVKLQLINLIKQKKIYKIHANISKQIGKAKTLVEKKTENRILQEDF